MSEEIWVEEFPPVQESECLPGPRPNHNRPRENRQFGDHRGGFGRGRGRDYADNGGVRRPNWRNRDDEESHSESHPSGMRRAPENSIGVIDFTRPERRVLDNLPSEFGNLTVNSDPPKVNWAKAKAEYEEYQKVRWNHLPAVIKVFYKEPEEVTRLTDEQVEQLRAENNNITVGHMKESDTTLIPKPVFRFEHCFKDYPEIMQLIMDQGFDKPSPIQCQAWPVLLQGLDLIGIAQTGTGKTLAFLLPAMIHLHSQPTVQLKKQGSCNPKVLIMAPTRELAIQIEMESRKFRYKDTKTIVIYGGASRRDQINEVKKHADIIVATPGRLNDLVMNGIINVETVTYLVLDEADRMLDMGFEPQIRKVLLDIRPDRQTVMTSATWPEDVRRLAESYMKSPIQVVVGSLDLAAVHSVTQNVEIVREDQKLDMLLDFIASMADDDKVIVFVGRKDTADYLSTTLSLKDIVCQCIHGGRDQEDRVQALEDLKSGDVRILVATDVASRGIDIKDVTHIFNYDMPNNVEEYVHRVGRTGRAGKTGEALTLMTTGDSWMAPKIIDIMEEANQVVPQGLARLARKYLERKEEEGRLYPDERRRGRGGRGGGRRGGGRRGGGSNNGFGRDFGGAREFGGMLWG